MSDGRNIQWFPGHMAKTMRLIDENMRLADVIIYVLDARIPDTCLNPAFAKAIGVKPVLYLLNKADLADPAASLAWERRLRPAAALSVTATMSKFKHAILKEITALAADKIARRREKGLNYTPKTMVIGIPNTGKSTVINSLAGARRAAVGDRPGVTRGKQWVRVEDKIDLLDMPGALPTKFESQLSARHAAYVGGINDTVTDASELACALLAELAVLAPDAVAGRYGVTPCGSPLQDLERIAAALGCIKLGAVPDSDRAAAAFIDDFRKGKLGRITLERPY
ncbi:MAG: ribosome biogenesis GTPase YlqF [Clostridiales bacterium]|nr:ribosome biogenesis GTPase YlqF [Clostridiales bacterium]